MISDCYDPVVLEIISVIKDYHPSKIRTLRQCMKAKGVTTKLKLIGEGAFRQCFVIGNTDYVLKIPNSYDGDWHSKEEMKALKRLHSQKYKALHPFLPKVYFHDKSTGIIIMKRYEKLKGNHYSAVRILERVVQQLTGWEWCDVKKSNVGMTFSRDYVIIDFGCFSEEFN